MTYALWAVGIIAAAVLILLPLAFAGGLLHVVFSFGGNFPFIHFTGGLDNPNALLPLRDIPASLSLYLGLFGLAGFFHLWFDRTQSWQLKLFFTVCIGVLLVISQVPEFVFPVRFSRELGAPATLLAAYFIVSTAARLASYTWRVAWVGAVAALFLTTGLAVRVQKMTQLPLAVEFLHEDADAAQYIRAHALAQDCVVVIPRNRYYQYFLPGHSVIAYALSPELRTSLDASLNGEPASIPDCEYFVAERIPGDPDWNARLKQLGFIEVARFDGAKRGVTVFESGFHPREQ